MKTAIVLPTIRDTKPFMKAWERLFEKHNVELVVVQDGEYPTVNSRSIEEVMGKHIDCLTNFNAGIRNLGFAYVAKYLPEVEVIITLDDDEVPVGDTIQDHLDALSRRVPVSWISTAVDDYTRGFPYEVRSEAPVMLSHGVWEGVADWDAPTQLVRGSRRPVAFYRGPIPKGVYYPMCSMNLAFKVELLPYIFHAPWALGVNRFDDIFTGIVCKREMDKLGWAAVTGYATVNHDRASNVYKNLQHEAKGIELLETFWQGDEKHEYFALYRDKLRVWKEYLETLPQSFTQQTK